MSDADPFFLLVTLMVYGVPVVLTFGGWIIGGLLENRHFRSIRSREALTRKLAVIPSPSFDEARGVQRSELIVASTVVSLDYFKRILAALRNLFGGRVGSYESLLDRAKREAILRLKEQVPDADIIVNLRIQTSQITQIQGNSKGVGAVEVLAFGTAVWYGS